MNVMQQHYKLAYIRKPELLGNSRVYDDARAAVTDLPWPESAIKTRLAEYQLLSNSAEQIANKIPSTKKDAFYELIKYPIQAAAQMNFKMLYGQLARHGKSNWASSEKAFNNIKVLTQIYNSLQNGKWSRMMDFQPRRLPVFEPLDEHIVDKPLPADRLPLYHWEGSDNKSASLKPVEGLGYDGRTARLFKNQSLIYSFKNWNADSIEVEVRLVPTHAIAKHLLRIAVSLDGGSKKVINYETADLSEEWKDNVLRNQSIQKFLFKVPSLKRHKLTLTALDEGVVLDQIYVFAHP